LIFLVSDDRLYQDRLGTNVGKKSYRQRRVCRDPPEVTEQVNITLTITSPTASASGGGGVATAAQHTIVKRRRFARHPPPPQNSSITAFQLDHERGAKNGIFF
jgi:hypothetical protein